MKHTPNVRQLIFDNYGDGTTYSNFSQLKHMEMLQIHLDHESCGGEISLMLRAFYAEAIQLKSLQIFGLHHFYINIVSGLPRVKRRVHFTI